MKEMELLKRSLR